MRISKFSKIVGHKDKNQFWFYRVAENNYKIYNSIKNI